MEQRTEEWYTARAGKVTASRVADVIARTKTGYGASRATYMAELVIERITGQPVEKFSSPAMQWAPKKSQRPYQHIKLKRVLWSNRLDSCFTQTFRDLAQALMVLFLRMVSSK
jgi:hypothetical protein